MGSGFNARIALVAVTAGLALTASTAPALAGTVKYDLNGPAGVVHEHTEKGNVEVEEIGVDFDGLGALTGWNTKRDGTGRSYSVGEDVVGDVTLFAQYADGTMLAADLVEVGGKTYYYADGKAQTGFISVAGLGGHDSALAYFDPSSGGAMVKASTGEKATWLEVDGKSYLADEDGALVGTATPAKDDDAIKTFSGSTRYKDAGGRYYLFASDGSQKTGLVELAGEKFLFTGAADGAHAGNMVMDTLVDAAAAGTGVAGANVYPTEDGLAVGLVDVARGSQTAKYWFGADGVSSAGWHKAEINGKACWVHTSLDGRVTAVSDSDPEAVKVDREHLGGAESVENVSALSAVDETHAAGLGEAIKAYMASVSPNSKFTLSVADGSTNELVGATVTFSPAADTARRDKLSFVWGENGQAYGWRVEKTETEATPNPDAGKDDNTDKGKDDNTGAGKDDNTGAGKDDDTDKGKDDNTDKGDKGDGGAGTGAGETPVEHGGTADDGTNVTLADKQAGTSNSSDDLPQTGVPAVAAALAAGGTAAAAFAGGKLVWGGQRGEADEE